MFEKYTLLDLYVSPRFLTRECKNGRCERRKKVSQGVLSERFPRRVGNSPPPSTLHFSFGAVNHRLDHVFELTTNKVTKPGRDIWRFAVNYYYFPQHVCFSYLMLLAALPKVSGPPGGSKT